MAILKFQLCSQGQNLNVKTKAWTFEAKDKVVWSRGQGHDRRPLNTRQIRNGHTKFQCDAKHCRSQGRTNNKAKVIGPEDKAIKFGLASRTT